MPIWKAWRVARIVSIYDRQSIIIDSAGAVITLKNVAIEAANKTIAAQDSTIKHKDNETLECRKVITASDALHELQLKTARKKGRKEGAGAAGIVAIIISVLALL